MDTKEYIQGLIDRARTAQQEFETYSQEQVDKAVRGIGKIIYDNGEMLARMAVDETRMGKYEDKIVKNKAKAKIVWYKLKGVKSRRHRLCSPHHQPHHDPQSQRHDRPKGR